MDIKVNLTEVEYSKVCVLVEEEIEETKKIIESLTNGPAASPRRRVYWEQHKQQLEAVADKLDAALVAALEAL